MLSNFDSRLVKVLADLEIAPLFDWILLPMHTGVHKPDAAAFLAALDAAGVSPPPPPRRIRDKDGEEAAGHATGQEKELVDQVIRVCVCTC